MLPHLSVAAWEARVAGRRRFQAPELDPGSAERLAALFGRPVTAAAAVAAILDEVRQEGDPALVRWTSRLDGVDPRPLRVPAAALSAAWQGLEADLQQALTLAHQRITDFHTLQRDARWRGSADLGLRPGPVERAGLYVPGGRAAYPSTVLMTAAPARVAGVPEVVVVTPPRPDGTVAPTVLAAAHLAGVTAVYRVGGAQAIAALAYGTASIPAVDVIAGPGNIFVTLAKQQVVGAVGIDGLAGPSEVLVIAGGDADPDHVAADLVSQLEHDPLAWAVCLTDDPAFAAALRARFTRRAGEAARSGIIAAAAGAQAAVVVVRDLAAAVALANAFAPEHLSLQGRTAEPLAEACRTAGALFIGPYAPVSLGDYTAGPNHTLPTGGAARFHGPLAVDDFVRWTSVVRMDETTYRPLAEAAIILATSEGLEGHAAALRARFPPGG